MTFPAVRSKRVAGRLEVTRPEPLSCYFMTLVDRPILRPIEPNGPQMEMFYYDQITGDRKMKRRYKYAAIAYAVGMLTGLIMGNLL